MLLIAQDVRGNVPGLVQNANNLHDTIWSKAVKNEVPPDWERTISTGNIFPFGADSGTFRDPTHGVIDRFQVVISLLYTPALFRKLTDFDQVHAGPVGQPEGCHDELRVSNSSISDSNEYSAKPDCSPSSNAALNAASLVSRSSSKRKPSRMISLADR